jgi:hypothetical protein
MVPRSTCRRRDFPGGFRFLGTAAEFNQNYNLKSTAQERSNNGLPKQRRYMSKIVHQLLPPENEEKDLENDPTIHGPGKMMLNHGRCTFFHRFQARDHFFRIKKLTYVDIGNGGS